MSKYILTIDGGGTRGAFPAAVIELIEKRFGMKFEKKFDLVAGTSTGAIVGAGIATGSTGKEIREWYEEKEGQIFGKKNTRGLLRIPSFRSLYKGKALNKVLQERFGDLTLNEVEKPLIIPATELRSGKVHVFKSGYHKEFKRDRDVKVWEAVRASCAAPTYFDPHRGESTSKGLLLADGGLWCNNPGLMAVVDAQYRLGWKREEIKVLTLGTGGQRVQYDARSEKHWLNGIGWGILTGWEKNKILKLCFSLQGETAHNMLCLSLGESPLIGEGKQVLRIDWETDANLTPDEVGGIENHTARADRAVTHWGTKIEEFLGEG